MSWKPKNLTKEEIKNLPDEFKLWKDPVLVISLIVFTISVIGLYLWFLFKGLGWIQNPGGVTTSPYIFTGAGGVAILGITYKIVSSIARVLVDVGKVLQRVDSMGNDIELVKGDIKTISKDVTAIKVTVETHEKRFDRLESRIERLEDFIYKPKKGE